MSKRYISLGVVVALFFCGVLGRVGYIFFSGTYAVSDSYNSYVVTVDVNEPQLYFADGSKINNNVPVLKAVIRPTTTDLAEVSKIYDKKAAADIANELKDGYPVVRSIDTKDTKLRTLTAYDTDTTLRQVISSDSSGLLLYSDIEQKRLTVNYQIDARGRMLTGDNGTLHDSDYLSREGYVLTIDKELQQICFEAAKNIQNGTVIVMDAHTSRILACVNKPDDTYINKTFAQYNVGSVFKLVTAACALENDCLYQYVCNGSVKVGDTVFSCQNHHAHGVMNLKTALARSCNCYFINLALELGADRMLATAKAFGFSDPINLFDEWNVTPANLPKSEELESKGELSLFGFGQGKLTASPLQICSLLCTISNGGQYTSPSLVRGKKEINGSLTEYPLPDGYQVINEETAANLLSDMRYVVTKGTASNAETAAHQSAGTTATARAGRYQYGTEIKNTWFAGVYPYESPMYCIVVMCENGTSGATDCCPVFRTIVENIAK